MEQVTLISVAAILISIMSITMSTLTYIAIRAAQQSRRQKRQLFDSLKPISTKTTWIKPKLKDDQKYKAFTHQGATGQFE